MLTVWMIAGYIFYIWLNIGIACIQRDIVDYRIRHGNPKQIEHLLWTIIYFMVVTPMWFILHSWWYIGAVTLQHLFAFGMAYAVLSKNNPFYLSKTSKSKTEQFLLRYFKSAEIPYLIAFLISVGLLIKSVL